MDWSSGIAKLYGEGRKERYEPFSSHTAKALQRYQIREREARAPEFFLWEEGQTRTKSGLYQLCKRISIESEVPVAPHKLRHTFAITYLRAGGNAFSLQKLLGHTTLHTTLTEVVMITDDLVTEHRDRSPVDAMLRRRRWLNSGPRAVSSWISGVDLWEQGYFRREAHEDSNPFGQSVGSNFLPLR
jgi:integrase/recombinase XerD